MVIIPMKIDQMSGCQQLVCLPYSLIGLETHLSHDLVEMLQGVGTKETSHDQHLLVKPMCWCIMMVTRIQQVLVVLAVALIPSKLPMDQLATEQRILLSTIHQSQHHLSFPLSPTLDTKVINSSIDSTPTAILRWLEKWTLTTWDVGEESMRRYWETSSKMLWL